ncbi:MAG: PD-(D/E)XK nuclease family protein, partial [Candidatus Helarchaeota archaeon]
MTRLKFSVTDIKNASRCPRLFVLNKKYKKKIWRYSGIVIGSLVHHTIDAFIKSIKTSTPYQQRLQQCQSSKDFLALILQSMYSLYLDQIVQFKEKIRSNSDLAYYQRGFNRGWKILQKAADLICNIIYPTLSTLPLQEAIPKIFLDTEWSFQLDLEIQSYPFTLSGRIDWISHDVTSHRVFVWDFKTSESTYWHLDFIQIALYTIAIKEKLAIDADPAVVYFTEDSIKILEFDKAKIAEITPLFYNTLLLMRRWYLSEEDPPQTVDRIYCSQCNVQNSCWKKYGKLSEKQAQIADPRSASQPSPPPLPLKRPPSPKSLCSPPPSRPSKTKSPRLAMPPTPDSSPTRAPSPTQLPAPNIQEPTQIKSSPPQ